MAESNRLVDLLDKLIEATENGRAQWAATHVISSRGADGQGVRYTSADAGLQIYPRDFDDSEPYVLDILNSRGQVIQSYETERQLVRGEPTPTELSRRIIDLYPIAKENSVTPILDSLFLALEDASEDPF